jgi:signal transduction histidine kinase
MEPHRQGLSLFIRVGAFVFVAMAATVSTLGAISYFAAQRIISQQVEERLLLAAAQRTLSIEMHIRQQHERVRLIASRTRLRQQLRAWSEGQVSSLDFRAEANQILTDAMRGSEDIQEIWLSDATGTVVAATDARRLNLNLFEDASFQHGRQGPFLSEIRRENGQTLTWLSAPALDSRGNLLGVVSVVMRATRLISIVSNPTGLGHTGEVLVGRLDNGGQIRYLHASRLTGSESIAVSQAPSMAKAIDGQRGFETARYAGREVLIAYEPVPFQPGVTNWGLVVKITTQEAFTPLQNLRRIELPLGLLLLVSAVISAYWLANRYARPIMELARSADILAAGNLKHRVLVESDDEIGALSRAFNDMASQLEASYDVLERRVAERTAALSRANRALERSNRDLEQFAYVASHDLQEPLRAVAGFARMLSQQHGGQLSAQAREYVQFIIGGADRMKVLIDNLLEFSRIRSQGAPLVCTDSRQALQHALDNLSSTIEQRQAVITAAGLGEVLADPSQLTQLFQNLIGNAIKFCDRRPPRVEIRAEYGEQQVTITVTDNGIGMDPKDFQRIFEIFQRLHASGTYPGAGMGLAICQQIVQRHGGRIWVESRVGQGSSFHFTLGLPGETLDKPVAATSIGNNPS